MKVSVVIPTLAGKNTDYLKVCVDSLRASTDWDIIVVSNGGKDKPNYSHIKGITLHLHTSDQGQANATNIGSQAVSKDTDYIFVTNDDMYYAPDWNKNIDFRFNCFSPNLVEPTNNAGSAKPFLKCNGGFTLEEFNKEVVDDFIKKGIKKDLSYPRIEVGFNLPFFIDKKLWDTIEGYDIAYDPWGSNSDTDLQTKIELAGTTPIRQRDMLVYHFSNKSGTFDGTHQEFWQFNWDYYTEKWGFNRDDTNGDPWYCTNMIDYERLKFHPSWKGKFKGDKQ